VFEAVGPTDVLTHGFQGGETWQLARITSTEDMTREDSVLLEHGLKRSGELAGKLAGKLAAGEKPYLLEHCFMKVYCDNFEHPVPCFAHSKTES
jgi:hypothetical protein